MAAKRFSSSESFGKRLEFWAIAELLRRGYDVYVTLVDDQGIDCVVRQGREQYFDVQVKARSALFGSGVIEIGCMAHARRKFHDLYANQRSASARAALALYGALYELEREAREQRFDALGRPRLREERGRPIADALHTWSLASGASCSFTSPRGSMTGTCSAREGKALACKPPGPPPGGGPGEG